MEAGVVVCGQVFGPQLLDRINATVREQPEITRAELARRVCDWLGWRTSLGRLKAINCRVALGRLAKRGLIELPAPRWAVRFGGPSFSRSAQDDVAARFTATLQEVGGLKLVGVSSKDRELDRVWKKLVAVHHYLGYQPLCGAQLRYLIASEQGWLGALAFSAPAWHLKARDRFIGWSPPARRCHLAKVVANSRFVIARSVRVNNLASKVLALAQKRLCEDWAKAYGYRPLLLETYVEARRFAATSYRAANWTKVGKTSGRGRQDREHRNKTPIKDIYVYPLASDWQKQLCEEPGPARCVAGLGHPAKPARDWAEQELGRVKLRDRRHRERLLVVARDFYAQPQANIPQACQSRARTKAAYRLFGHKAVTMDAILTSHYHATMERIATEKIPVILAVQDTTSFNYATHPDMEGLGPIGTHVDGAQGMLMHDTMAYTTEGTALGLVDIQVWARDPKQFGKKVTRHQRPIEQKESSKWLKSFAAAARLQRQLGSATTVVSVGDREADIYELFLLAQKDSNYPKLLIRAEQDRRVQDTDRNLWSYMHSQAVAGTRELLVRPTKNRAGRRCVLAVRFAPVELRAPKNKSLSGALGLWAVYVTEVNPPSAKEAIEWMLLTTLEVNTYEQALEKIDWYNKRWGIEEYHRTLKSICRIENRQLGDRTVWQNCLAIDLVVAWRIEHIKKLARTQPNQPCTIAFAEHEWQALLAFKRPTQPLPATPPNLREATRLTAEMGGFLGRKADGEPGSQTLARGLQRLQDIATAFLLFKQQQLSPLQQNPDSHLPVPSLKGYG